MKVEFLLPYNSTKKAPKNEPKNLPTENKDATQEASSLFIVISKSDDVNLAKYGDVHPKWAPNCDFNIITETKIL